MTETRRARGVQPRSIRRLFAAVVALGSFLLLLMEPLVVWPALSGAGDAPTIWIGAILGYQALLLAGYAYAGLLGRLPPRRQAAIQYALLAAGLLWLLVAWPVDLPVARGASPLGAARLVLLAIGPPFLALAAQAPVMQGWLGLRQPRAHPFPLHAMSNLAAVAGLAAFPLFDRWFAPAARFGVVCGGYALLLALVGAAAATLPKRHRIVAPNAPATLPPAPGRWSGWILSAAISSALMLATTRDLGRSDAAPLSWLLPLGLYLLSFSIAFAPARRPVAAIGGVAPALMVVAAGLLAPGRAAVSAGRRSRC